ncbi:MAG: dihydrodipicolinate synthase family protein [Planctomycetota bacterium]
MPHLTGVIPPIVTPLTADGQFDDHAMLSVVEHLLAGGVSGIFALGTTGEGPSLTARHRYAVIDRVCELVMGRVPVLCCITDTSYSESLQLATHAHSSGADAVVAAAPFYFDVSQAALTDWFRRLADESPLPLLLYNMPSCVGTVLSLDLVAELHEHPNVAGIKDSGGDLRYFQQLCVQFRQPGRFSVFMGPEELLADAVTLGGDGGVCGGANLLPSVYTRLYSAARKADSAEIARLHAIIHDLFAAVYRDEHGRMKLIPGLKLAMELAGLCLRFTAPPLQAVGPEHAERIEGAVRRLGSFAPVSRV